MPRFRGARGLGRNQLTRPTVGASLDDCLPRRNLRKREI